MAAYQCPNCGTIYEEMTQDGMCEKAKCFGIDLVEYSGPSIAPAPVFPSVGIVDGLCLLICDISFSMGERAFADNEVTKLEMVTQAIQSALVELYRISKPAEAFIGIIAFGA